MKKKLAKMLKKEMSGDGLKGLPEKLKGKMAVKVMADSPEGLKEGLEKAEEVLESKEEMEEDESEMGGLKEMLDAAFSKRMKKPSKKDKK